MRIFALIAVFIFFFSAAHVYAADISFSNNPPTIQKDQEVTLDVTLNGAASNTTNYIRASFFHANSPTSYFGYVHNSNNWYNGTPSPIDAKQFLAVQINNEGTWSGQLKVKVDTDSPYFKGNGGYFLKVGRYTASATSISNWSSAVPIEIQGATPIPTPTEKPAPTEKPQTAKTVSVPRNSAVSTTPVIEEENLEEEIEEEVEDEEEYAVLGAFDSGPTQSISPPTSSKPSSSPAFPSLFLVLGAGILIIGCGILLLRAYKKQKAEEI